MSGASGGNWNDDELERTRVVLEALIAAAAVILLAYVAYCAVTPW